jgi:hypothetical protein
MIGSEIMKNVIRLNVVALTISTTGEKILNVENIFGYFKLLYNKLERLNRCQNTSSRV